MAHDVKLDVLTFQIKKHGKDVFLDFDKIPDTTSDEDGAVISFVDFFTRYVQSFDGRFHKQVKTGKAIALTAGNTRVASTQRIVSGLLQGGTTGIGREIKNPDNVDESVFQVGVDHIESIPYYFMLWFPVDSNLGIAIVQSIGNKSMTNVFKQHFKTFVRSSLDKKASLVINNHVPQEVIKKMRKKGLVNTVLLRRLHLPSDKAEKILGLKYTSQDITVEIKISGLKNVNGYKDKVVEYLKGDVPALFDSDSLDDLGIDGNHETIVQFEHNGQVAKGSSNNGFELSPTYIVDEGDIKRNSEFHPTYTSMHKYCISFLEVLKKEVKYKPVKS